MLTRDGVALGIAPSTGAVVGLSWPEMSGGVLVAGADARQVTLTCLQLVHAAVRRRKPVIVLDDGREAGIAHALAATCLATGTPLRRGDLGQVVSERSAALVPAGSAGSAAAVAADVAALGAQLRRIGVDGDGLVWVPSAERLPAPVLAALVRDGAAAGLPVLAGAESPAAAAELAGLVGALLVHRVTDRDLADCLAARAGTRLLPAAAAAMRAGQPFPASAGQPVVQPVAQQAILAPGPVIEPRALLSLRPDEFVLVGPAPRRRVVARVRLVPARLPRYAEQRRKP